MSDFKAINLHHKQQDVHQIRRPRHGHVRYRMASQLWPDVAVPAQVLEVGCGRAEYARALRDLGHTVTVTDLSPSNVEAARELGFTAHQLDLNLGLPVFTDELFDVAVILEVIEHVVAAEFLLQEIQRVLKPGGYLILSTPNFAFWQNRIRILWGQLSHDEGYHYRFFTVKSLSKQLQAAGFSVQDWRFTMPAFGINLVRRWLGKTGRKHLGLPQWSAPLLAQTMIVRAVK
ncbi:MAG: class I SAM-dependent methyltransferase [Ardenticatenaceae bacterium]|nr:class I SAM-dependent methyltransferase [Ardenticatenaceae bacterium]